MSIGGSQSQSSYIQSSKDKNHTGTYLIIIVTTSTNKLKEEEKYVKSVHKAMKVGLVEHARLHAPEA